MKSRRQREGHDPKRKGSLDAHPNDKNRTFRKDWMRAFGFGPVRRMTKKEIIEAKLLF